MSYKRLLPTTVALLLAACGSSNGSTTNLKPVFFRTVAPAPVATLTMQRQNGAPMTQAKVTLDTHATFDGWLKVGRGTSVKANASGVAALALASGTWAMRISSGVPQSTALVGELSDSLSISADTNRTYQTSQQSWTVTSPVAVKALEVVIYQVDGSGKASYGTTDAPLDPVVLTANPAVPGGNATSVTFSTELFKGSFRAVITATPVASTDNVAPFETAVINAAGGGATEPQSVGLASGGNLVSLHFADSGGAAVPDAQIGTISIYDAGSLVFLNSGNPSGGVATLSTGAIGPVVAVVEGPNGETLAATAYTASPTHTATLTRYTVAGHVKPTGSAQLTASGNNNYGSVDAALQTGLGAFWDARVQGAPSVAKITDAAGTWQAKLFGGSYSLKAVALHNLPPSAPVAASLSADAPTQDIAVDPGGVISGNLQDEAHNNLAGVSVSVVDSSHATIGSATSDATGNYSIAVPFGTYEVFAGGALTQNVAVSSSAATNTLNLTRFQITGRMTDAALGPVAGTIYFGGGNVTATTLGTYTLNAFQGINWVLFTPPSTSPSLGFAYETNVLVNADTVKSIR